MKTFYTYLWLREDGTPYYVGKGLRDRAFHRHRVGKCPPKERVILQEWPSEQDAFVAERFLITYYGRVDQGTGCLRNLTDGGEGVSGFVPRPVIRTLEWRKKQSDAAKRRYQDPEERRKSGLVRKGHSVSEEARKKISEWNKQNSPKRGKKLSAETRERIRLGWIKRRNRI